MSEGHTGVGDIAGHYEYTYEHAEEPPEGDSDFYRITTYNNYTDRPIHVNKYYLPPQHLDRFFLDYHQTGERVVDIRPVTEDEAESEIEEYRS